MLDVLDQGSSNEYFAWKPSEQTFKIDGQACDVTKFAIDPQSLQTGWGRLAKGEAPDFCWSQEAGTSIPKPSDDHKTAFMLNVFVSQKGGAPENGWREWREIGAGAKDGLKMVWPEVEKTAEANKLVVVEVTEKKPVKIGMGSSVVPILKVVGLVDKPAEEPAPAPAPATTDDEIF